MVKQSQVLPDAKQGLIPYWDVYDLNEHGISFVKRFVSKIPGIFGGGVGDVLLEAFNTAAIFSYIQLIQEKQGFDAG